MKKLVKLSTFAIISLSLVLVAGTLSAQTPIKATLSWTDNSTNEDGCDIERGTGAQPTFTKVGSVGPNVVSFVDTPLTPGVTYCWRITAFNSAGRTSSPSACATAPLAPNAPGGLQIIISTAP